MRSLADSGSLRPYALSLFASCEYREAKDYNGVVQRYSKQLKNFYSNFLNDIYNGIQDCSYSLAYNISCCCNFLRSVLRLMPSMSAACD